MSWHDISHPNFLLSYFCLLFHLPEVIPQLWGNYFCRILCTERVFALFLCNFKEGLETKPWYSGAKTWMLDLLVSTASHKHCHDASGCRSGIVSTLIASVTKLRNDSLAEGYLCCTLLHYAVLYMENESWSRFAVFNVTFAEAKTGKDTESLL